MKVLCTSNSGAALPEDYLDPRVNLTRSTGFPVTVGREYVVYAVIVLPTQVWYYLVDDDDLWYPMRKPAPLFRVIDDRLSQHWRYLLTPGNPDHTVLLAFSEWVSEEWFYDRLTDAKQREVEIFKERKRQMDVEFIEPNCPAPTS